MTNLNTYMEGYEPDDDWAEIKRDEGGYGLGFCDMGKHYAFVEFFRYVDGIREWGCERCVK